jgi:hypothetical protein
MRTSLVNCAATVCMVVGVLGVIVWTLIGLVVR